MPSDAGRHPSRHHRRHCDCLGFLNETCASGRSTQPWKPNAIPKSGPWRSTTLLSVKGLLWSRLQRCAIKPGSPSTRVPTSPIPARQDDEARDEERRPAPTRMTSSIVTIRFGRMAAPHNPLAVFDSRHGSDPEQPLALVGQEMTRRAASLPVWDCDAAFLDVEERVPPLATHEHALLRCRPESMSQPDIKRHGEAQLGMAVACGLLFVGQHGGITELGSERAEHHGGARYHSRAADCIC